MRIIKRKYIQRQEIKISEDVIAAISTPIGTSGIGIVRMSGENSLKVLEKIFLCKQFNKEKILSHHMYHGFIVDEKRNIVDEVLVCIMLAPKSYTCENVVEINCHGGFVCVRQVLNLVLNNGARMAEPGEFTKRAYLNGRIDLVQAQAVIDIINSKTELSKRIAVNQLKGGLSRKIENCKQKTMDIMAQIEASIDFPEEYETKDISDKINEISEMVKDMIDSAAVGEIVRNGINIAIIGKPNVGKSSLLNLLAQKDTAIVTEIPGTTRDIVHEYINISGVPAKILDTAGIHYTEDAVEKIGIQKAKDCVVDADLVLVIFDWSRELDSDDMELINFLEQHASQDSKKILFIANKVDLEQKFLADNELFHGHDLLRISVEKNFGLENLLSEIKKIVFGENEKILDKAGEDFVSDLRQKLALEKSLASLLSAQNTVEDGLPCDLVSIDLADAYEFLSQITGNFVDESLGDKIADEVFSKFCVGK